MAGDIHYLADEIKSGNFLALHGAGGQFVGAHAASSDLSFGEAFSTGRNHLPIVRAPFKFSERVIGEVGWRVNVEPPLGATRRKMLSKRNLCRGQIARSGWISEVGGEFLIWRQVNVQRFAGLPVGGDLQDGWT